MALKHNTPAIRGGGVRKDPIGKSGNTRNPAPAGGHVHSHMPHPSSYSNAGVKGKGHVGSDPKSSSRPGPRWGHLPNPS